MDLNIKKMLSIPPEIPLTSIQRFTFVSAIMAYVIGGLGMTFAPDIFNLALQLDFSGYGRGYFMLIGCGLAAIGLCYVVLSRNKASQLPNAGPVLGTIVSRLVLVNVVILLFYTQGIINGRFCLLFCLLDSTLSLITCVIWSRGNTNSSFVQFLRETWSAVNPISEKSQPYAVLQVLGFVQFIASLVVPSILISRGIVSSSIQGSHEEGLLRSYFATLAVHAVLHILAAGSENDSFPIATVFYRLVWNIPVLFLLGFTSQIPVGLANILMVYDVIFMVVTIVLFFAKENRVKTN